MSLNTGELGVIDGAVATERQLKPLSMAWGLTEASYNMTPWPP